MTEPSRTMKIAAQLGDENYLYRLALEKVLAELESQQGAPIIESLHSTQKCKIIIMEALNNG